MSEPIEMPRSDPYDHPGAPAAGTVLCAVDDLADQAGKGFEFGSGKTRFRMFVIRLGDHIHGYINECPHAFTPLDWEPDKFFSQDGDWLICATHGARFYPDSGLCQRGPCKGQSLTALPIDIADGQVVVGQ